MQQCTPVIPELGRWRQEDLRLEASLDYIVRLYLKKREIRLSLVRVTRGGVEGWLILKMEETGFSKNLLMEDKDKYEPRVLGLNHWKGGMGCSQGP
jgi:hypothetical protein